MRREHWQVLLASFRYEMIGAEGRERIATHSLERSYDGTDVETIFPFLHSVRDRFGRTHTKERLISRRRKGFFFLVCTFSA